MTAEMPTIRVVRYEYPLYDKGDLIENLQAPYEMGIVERRLLAERTGPDGKWLCTYLVAPYCLLPVW